MTPHQSLAVAVRLFAIWLAIYVARDMLGLYVLGRKQGDPHSLAIAVAVSALAVLFLIVLWFFPRTITRGLLPVPSDAPPQRSSPEIWFAAGSSLIGLWVMTSAVPALIRNLTVMYLSRSDSVDLSGLRSALLYYFVEFAVGVWLIVGAPGIRRFIWWARSAGPD